MNASAAPSDATSRPLTLSCGGQHVQDQLRANAEKIIEWLASGGTLYTCGSNRLGKGVPDVLGEVMERNDEDVQRLRGEGRLFQEFWGALPEPLKMGGMALVEAVKNGNHNAVEKLLDMGVNVNFQATEARATRIGMRQEVGETALHWATVRGDDIAAKRLLAARANPDLQDRDGKTPLHLASFNGVPDVLKTLLEANCNPDLRDARGNTALHWVMLAGGSLRMIKLLLNHGANAAIANEQGESAVDAAAENGFDAAVGLLESTVVHT